MKRTFISKEHLSEYKYGTYGHKVSKSFMSSALMDIPKSILIDNLDIVYYQNINGEQISLDAEVMGGMVLYNTSNEKLKNSNLIISPEQNEYQRDNNTIWDLSIDYNSLLSGYIFSKIKKSRAFEGLLSENVVDINVDMYIRKYINKNILPKYKVSNVDIFLEYIDLSKVDGFLRFNNVYDINLNITDVISSTILFNNNLIKCTFSQKENSKNFIFKYYYNITYKKV